MKKLGLKIIMIIGLFIFIMVCIWFSKKSIFNFEPKVSETNNIAIEQHRKSTINSLSDLTELLGYNFSNSNIYTTQIQPIDSSSCYLCVILNEPIESFLSDPFINGFSTEKNDSEEVAYKNFVNHFSLLCNINYYETNNNGCNMKEYIETTETLTQYIPYPINWFSAEIDGANRIVIYGLLPCVITDKMLNN